MPHEETINKPFQENPKTRSLPQELKKLVHKGEHIRSGRVLSITKSSIMHGLYINIKTNLCPCPKGLSLLKL